MARYTGWKRPSKQMSPFSEPTKLMRQVTASSGKHFCTWHIRPVIHTRRYTTKAFGQVMGKAAKVTIVEAEEIVPVGSIHPDNVHLPGIYVNRIVPALAEKVIEIRKLREVEGQSSSEGKKSDSLIRRERIARRTSKELKNGYYVNLGVGIPTLAPSYLSPETKVWIQSENGLLGMVSKYQENSCTIC
jgi:acyl CoA:acetate/3-ketoacid CoA transferase